MDCDLVISHYKENLDWLSQYKDTKFTKVIIYTKGQKNPKSPIPYIEKPLENIGRCDHTYLYHIVKNYDDLADVTIFTTGSSALSHKKKKLKDVIEKVFSTHDSVFLGGIHKSVKNDMYDFQLDIWKATNKDNRSAAKNSVLAKANVRPFGPWYEKHFPRIRTTLVNYLGIFAISKKHVHQHSKAYYQNLLDLFPNHSNPEVGHYFERAWLAVFHPIPAHCLYSNDMRQTRKTKKIRKTRKTRKQ